MKIELLLKREPFGEIFEKTLQAYLQHSTGIAHQVEWFPRTAQVAKGQARQEPNWLCNAKINAVFSTSASFKVFETPWREYLRGKTIGHTLAQAGYLALASAPISRTALATHGIRIQPELHNAPYLLILGGNTALKLVDHARHHVTTVLKHGFEPSFVTNGLHLRQGRSDLLAPPLIHVDAARSYYVEPLLHGTVADRLHDRDRANRSLLLAADTCALLFSTTRSELSWRAWWDRQQQACEAAAKNINDSSEHLVERTLKIHSKLGSELSKRNDDRELRVVLGQSHGDLQAGNVLVDGAQTWLIDWERVDQRVAAYDLFTLALDSRRQYQGLLQRMLDFCEGTRLSPLAALLRSRVETGSNPLSMHKRMILFLLEELRFHLEEDASGPLFGPSLFLGSLVAELECGASQGMLTQLYQAS